MISIQLAWQDGRIKYIDFDFENRLLADAFRNVAKLCGMPVSWESTNERHKSIHRVSIKAGNYKEKFWSDNYED